MTAPTAAVPVRIVLAEYYDDSITRSRWVCIEFACGHWSYAPTLPNGYPSCESLTDAVLGCEACSEVAA